MITRHRLFWTAAALCLAPVALFAGPLPPGGAAPALPEQAIDALRPSEERLPSGIYALESGMGFNTLDAVNYDAATGRLSLVGHFDPRFQGPQIPYLQHLATLLDLPAASEPMFSLDTVPASRRTMQAKVAGTSFSQRGMLSHFGKSFDGHGAVTHLGRAILPSLGLSPIRGHRPPGFFGAVVEPLPSGAVRVTGLFANSPADDAGLSAGDEIVRFNGRIPFSATEFERLVRFAGAGNKVTVSYVRRGQPADVTIRLVADANPDPWEGATRSDVGALLHHAAGQADRAKAAYLGGVLAAHLGTPSRLPVLKELARAVGTSPDAASEPALARTVLQRLDAKAAQAFDTELARTPDIDGALKAALQAIETAAPTADRMGEFARNSPSGFQVPAELVELVVGAHHEATPDYFGMAPTSQLARLMFEADYAAIKPIGHRTDLRGRLPGYQTLFEFSDKNPQMRDTMSTYRIWISVVKMDVAQSQSGTTLMIRDAAMRFNFLRDGADGRPARGAPSPAQAYGDMLTSLYDELAQDYFSLHEVREAAKVAAATVWLRQKTPSLRLPAEGRVLWTGPKRVPGMTFMQMPKVVTGDILLIPHGGLVLTPFPQGSVGLVIPMDRGAPELSNLPPLQTPPPDLGRAAADRAFGTPGSDPRASGWTAPTMAGGRPSGSATVLLPLPPGERAGLRDAPHGVQTVLKTEMSEAERKLRDEIARDRTPFTKAGRLVHLAEQLIDQGREAEALELTRQARALAPKSPLPLYLQARFEERLGNRRAAMESLKAALLLDPANAPAKAWAKRLQTEESRGLIPTSPSRGVAEPSRPGTPQGVPGAQITPPPMGQPRSPDTLRRLGGLAKGLEGSNQPDEAMIETLRTCMDGARGLPCSANPPPPSIPVPQYDRPQLKPEFAERPEMKALKAERELNVRKRLEYSQQMAQINNHPSPSEEDRKKLQTLNEEFKKNEEVIVKEDKEIEEKSMVLR